MTVQKENGSSDTTRADLVERLWESDAASALTNQAAREIERLNKDIAMLHGLDVTTREGQRAFAEWRNRSVQNAR